jgi:hypothetical protein
MRSCFGIVFLLSILGVVAATNAAPPKKTPPTQASLDADKLAPGTFNGTVVSIPNPDRIFTVEVVYQKVQLKPGQNLGRANQNLQRQYNHIMQLQNQMMRPPGRGHNPMKTMQQLQNAMVQFQNNLAQTQSNMFQVVNAKQKVDFQVEETVKVRVKELPEQFDDKGNIKQYTREELAELKGKDKNLPGYESSIDSLKPGQIVQVVLAVHKKPRPTPPPSSSSADKDKEAEKDKDKEIVTDKPKEAVKDKPKDVEKDKDTTVEHKLQVRTIVIVKDSDSSASPTSPKKKKK